MERLLKNAVVGQSGGPTAAINATLAGVIRGTKEHPEAIGTLYGMKNGVEGFLLEDLVDLTEMFDSEDKLCALAYTPAAALGSCRKKLPDPESGDPIYERIAEIFEKYNIGYYFYIGGNDSMDAVAKLSRYCGAHGIDVKVVGVPKTIDNDLCGTDHAPGYGSAAKYIAATVQEIIRDCAVYRVPAVTVVEIMGRDAGWLTAAAALGRTVNGEEPDLIYLPERVFDMDKFFDDIKAAQKRHPNVVVAVSEGIRFADGRYVGEGTQSGVADAFGHKYLAGTGKMLELAIRDAIGCKVRSIEINLPQRCAAHIQSKTDIDESLSVGSAAVSAAVGGATRVMMGIERVCDAPYVANIVASDINNIANQVRTVPDEYINAEGNGITDACVAYLLPLIAGETYPEYKNGLPVHFIIK
ncbi:MAG: 6-phosphofructokinase [Ruminococcaceae bacterium]|nr:6-phosphofructokinase [Oscillospiraceae bacterium]